MICHEGPPIRIKETFDLLVNPGLIVQEAKGLFFHMEQCNRILSDSSQSS